MGRWAILAAATAGALAVGFGGRAAAQAPAPPSPCTPTAELKFICGLKGAPEDLVRAPDSDWIIASGYAQGGAEGGITLIDSVSRLAQRAALAAEKPRAPFSDCDGPPDAAHLSTHGLNLKRTGRGKGLLFAVGHGGREAIEVYDVTAGGKDLPKLTWVGCIRPAQGSSLNSVAPFADGRIVYTDFVHAPATFADIGRKPTGAVYIWTPGKGPAVKIAGSELSGPNGVEVSADGRYVFVAVSGTGKVLRFDLKGPGTAPADVAPGLRADNLRWGPGGKLLMAGPDLACGLGDPKCPGRLRVSSLDPASLTVAPLLSVPVGPPFPSLSSGLVVGDTLWLGTFSGDRVAYAPLKR